MDYSTITYGTAEYRDLLGTLDEVRASAFFVTCSDRPTADRLAADLDPDLYRIDWSKIISKYIGETEKNLEVLVSGQDALVVVEVDAVDTAEVDLGAWMREAVEHASVVVLVTDDPDGLVGVLPETPRAHIVAPNG